MFKTIKRSVPVFLGLILGTCLLSFAYGAYYESPVDDAYQQSADTSIMPLGYWGDTVYRNYYLYSGDNVAVRRSNSGDYTLYLGTSAFTGINGSSPSGGGSVTSIPLASAASDSAWTTSNVNSVVSGVSDIKSGVSNINSSLITINSTIASGNSTLASINSALSTLNSNDTKLYNAFFSGNGADARGVMGGIYSQLQAIRSQTDSPEQSWSSLNPIYNKLMGPTGSINALIRGSFVDGDLDLTYNSIGEIFSQLLFQMTTDLTIYSKTPYLGSSGLSTSMSTNVPISFITSEGFLGLSSILRGPSGSQNAATIWTFNEDLEKEEEQIVFTNVLQALASIQSTLQQPLSQLQAVLANDDDLKLRQETQPQVEAVTDKFLGEGDAAPTPDDIGNMADWSNSMGDLFNSGVSAGQFFSSVTSSDSYSFFSQAVANDLDSSGVPAAISIDNDDYFSDYVLGDDGFYYIRDDSFFSLDSLFN